METLRDHFDYVQSGQTFVLRSLRLLKKFPLTFWSLRREIFSFSADSWRKIPQVNFLMMSADANKATIRGGQHFDKFLDSLSEELRRRGYTTAHLARPPATILGRRSFSKAHSVNRAFFWALFLDALSGRREDTGEGSHVFQMFRRMLSEKKPKAIFTIGYLPSLAAAAESLGIPLIEVLHARGYTADPQVWLTRGSPFLPSGVFSFDDVSSKTLRQAFGNADVEIFDMEDFAFRLLSPIPESLGLDNTTKTARNRVLVTLSWGFAGEDPNLLGMLSDGLLPNGLLESVELTKQTHLWTVRMHPVQVTSSAKLYRRQRLYLARLAEQYPNLVVDFGRDCSVYEALANSSHHITTCSMSVYEAAQLGIRSLVLSQEIPEQELVFSDLEADGWVEKQSDERQVILDWIQKTSPRAHGRVWKRKILGMDIDSFLIHPLINRNPQAGAKEGEN